MKNQRSLTILGATGSVGKSTLDLVRERPDQFKIKGLTANTNFKSLARLALEFKPESVVIADETYYEKMKELKEFKNVEKINDKKFGVDLIQKSDNKIINVIAQKVRAKL